MDHVQIPAISAPDVPDDAVLLDVREQDEWVAGHAPGAVHIPMSELLSRMAEVPAADPLVVVCRSGHRSAQVTAYFRVHGLDAVNLHGGMEAWQAAGRPMRSGTGAEPFVL